MTAFFKMTGIILLVIVLLFTGTFLVYFFNLDMKLLAKMKPVFLKIYERRRKERRI